jgi:hypothetical protein
VKMFKVLKVDGLPLAETIRLMDFDSVKESRFRRRFCVWLGCRGRILRRVISHCCRQRSPRDQANSRVAPKELRSRVSGDLNRISTISKTLFKRYPTSSDGAGCKCSLNASHRGLSCMGRILRSTGKWKNPIAFIVLGSLNISPTNSTCRILF